MRILRWLGNPDRLLAMTVIVIACFMFYLIGGKDEPYSPGAMAASTYPRLVLGCIIFTALLLIARPARQLAAGQNRSMLVGLPVIILMALYIALLETAGFFVLTPIFLVLLPLLAGFRRYGLIILSSCLVTVILYGVFVEVLNIPLPAGFLGD